MNHFVRNALAAAAALSLGLAPAAAQIRTVDPNNAIDADLGSPPAQDNVYYDDSAGSAQPQQQPETTYDTAPVEDVAGVPSPVPPPPAPVYPAETERAQSAPGTFKRDDLIGAAEGVFGKGAEGLAGIIEDILSEQGEPNAYIAGREAGGAFVVGLRYGSGTLFHNVEGERPVYWTGPSVGFDAGANAAKTFVLVYNLYDTQNLYQRFPAAEGAAYFVGGFNASYMRSGDIVLIPIRLGVGARLGANVGYMKFSEEQSWLPF